MATESEGDQDATFPWNTPDITGYEVTLFEHYGWPDSCYDAERNEMAEDPSYGIAFLKSLLQPYGLEDRWCYLAHDGTAYGMPRDQLAQACRECDVYLNLSNINWIAELEHCRRRALPRPLHLW
jgi:hypothetical protein